MGLQSSERLDKQGMLDLLVATKHEELERSFQPTAAAEAATATPPEQAPLFRICAPKQCVCLLRFDTFR